MSSDSASVRYVPIGQDQVTAKELKEFQITMAGIILFLLLGIVLLWWMWEKK